MSKKKTEFDALEKVAEVPKWLATPSPFDSLDSDWKKIILFYVFHSPVKGLSARGKKINDYGWIGEPINRNNYKILKTNMLKVSKNLESINWVHSGNYKDMRTKLKDVDLLNNFPSKMTNERVAFKKQYGGQIAGLLSHIRNAFAHGRISFFIVDKEETVVLEDVKKQGDKRGVTARIILYKQTLLNWIPLIEGGPTLSEAAIKSIKNNYKISY